VTLREQIVARARQEIGTPFVHQARVPGVGCDCIGLLIIVGRALGLVAPDFDIKGYSNIPDGKTLVARAGQFMTPIAREAMQVGDAIVMRWGKDPQHLGILGDYVHGGLSFIHAYCEVDGIGSVIETHYAPTYQKRFVAAFRLPGVPA
jgi:NlpC/P60 family putative phage cell wall peptidase